jgi:DNA polymerase I
VRAVESVLAPVGWREGEIQQHLSGTSDETLAGY